MKSNNNAYIKATIKSIIVAFIYAICVIVLVVILLGKQLHMAISLINYFVTDTSNAQKKDIQVDNTNGFEFVSYPAYGTQYATLKIDSLNLELPVYFGESMDILKVGVGHSSGSYFPGEGASIVYMAHNSADKFRSFSKLNIGDKINILTEYGSFNYEIYDMKIIQETDLDAIPIQKEKEILMMYTCYPFNNIGYATQRYVVYANLEV